jgi:glycosyltransferase involved in cell wall biosynthesis
MKIAIVSTTRYPTEKAYGVTIQHTCKALRQIGHQAQIYNPNFYGKDDSGNEVFEILRGNFSKSFVKALLRGSKILFGIRSIILGYKFKKIVGYEKLDLIWVRDTYFAATLRCLGVRIPLLIEIHHIPNGINLRVLRWLSTKNTGIATLTNTHRMNLNKKGVQGPICISPMGVPNSFFIEPKIKQDISTNKFGYIGRSTSSGSSNRLDVLVKDFLGARSANPHLQLTLIGLEEDARLSLSNLIDTDISISRSVVLVGNVPHSDVINYLSNIYCGIIPYMNSQYNSMRFPIKILEYAASSTHIIASDIPAHRALLNDTQVTFYDPEKKGSLAGAISYVHANEEEVSNKIREAYEWARNFTYENRVRLALACIVDLEMS